MILIHLPRAKLRNPLVAAALFRRAGAHRQAEGARRQRLNRETRREIERLKPSP